MKLLALSALLAIGVDARHHKHHHKDHGLIQQRVQGIDTKELQPNRHWNYPWPQGTDDSTDDDKILNWIREPKPPKPPIKYHDKMRMWETGTWPINHSWDDDWTKASYHNQIDDGTDDNEVVDLQKKAHLHMM